MANTVANLTAVLQMNNTKFKQGLSQSEKAMKAFKGQMMAIGSTIGAAFSVQLISRFTQEAWKLSAAAQGVEAAFNRIAYSGFLEELKTATAGTVSELELMKRAVMSSNFQIPLEQLATLFKFATKRAQETGESVDYLVNSIVLGIGRKSPLILDNLGISAVSLREKLNNVGHSGATVMDVAKAVGEIAQEEMRKAGEIIDTAAVKMERFKAAIQNAKKEFGDFLTGSTGFDQKLRDFSSKLDNLMYYFLPQNFNKFGGEEATFAWLDKLKNDPVLHTMPKDLERAQLNLKELFKTDASFDFKRSGLWAMSEAIGDLEEADPLGPRPEFVPPGIDSYISSLSPLTGITEMTVKVTEARDAAQELSRTLDTVEGDLEDITEGSQTQELVDQWNKVNDSLKTTEQLMADAKRASLELANTLTHVVAGFTAIGVAIAQIAGNAEQSLEDTAQSLLDSIGSILVSFGGWFALAGVILQGGSAVWDALETPDSTVATNGNTNYGTANVQFTIQGRDLVGAIENENSFRGVTR